ncbi:MAG: hypothetical protein V4664_01940 [Patescibacteria group bacterium]
MVNVNWEYKHQPEVFENEEEKILFAYNNIMDRCEDLERIIFDTKKEIDRVETELSINSNDKTLLRDIENLKRTRDSLVAEKKVLLEESKRLIAQMKYE